MIALPPEFILPQDGHDKQDCERAAGKRWLEKHAKQVAPLRVTLLGDDLYSNQPLCKLALENGGNFLFVCKPDSHATLYERVAFWQANDAIKELETRHRQSRFTEITMYRYMNEVLLRGGPGPWPSIGWSHLVNATTGEQLYHNSFITNHRLSADNVAQVAQAGRGRWKVESAPQAHRKEAWYKLRNWA